MRALLLAALMAALMTGAAHAQGAGGGGVNPAQTDKVVTAIATMYAGCRQVETVYRPDCLSRALQRGASKIANNPGYWEANVALTRASRAMSRLVLENTDPGARRVRVEGYRLTAVAPAALPDLERAAAAVMARAEEDFTSLSDYERRAFAPIAALVGPERPWP